MSRGPGRIERVVEAVFITKPDEYFMLDELALLAYPELDEPDEPGFERSVEKKHRVAVARAADKVCNRIGWGIWHCEQPGGRNVYFNKRSVASYALARIRAEWNDYYRGEPTPDDLQAQLEKHKSLISPDGPWSRHVAEFTAELDGDVETVKRLREDRERHLATIAARMPR